MTPPVTVDQLEEGHALVLGTTGSGKTYTLRGLLEQLRRADRRVGAVDKLGNHWGLTASKRGTGPGLEFVIFGGRRAHVPMTPGQGAQLGRLFVERGLPAIFDVSEWKRADQERWVGAFADAVFETNTTALHLAFDEAQSWVPQGGGGEAFAAVQRLAEQGRGRGIRLLLTCQRLSRLDATVRGMMHTVVSMRQTATLDRKAVAELVASDKADQQLLEQLPKLGVGTGFFWDPARAGLELVRFPENATFDSSATPRHGDTPPAPIAVSSALVDELRAALAPPAEAEDGTPDDTIPAEAETAYRKGSVVGTVLRERDERIKMLEAANADLRAEVERLRGIDGECDRYQDGLEAIEQLVDAVRSGKPFQIDLSPSGGAAKGGDDEVASMEPPLAESSCAGAPAGAGTVPPAGAPGITAPTGGAPDREYRALAVLAAIAPAGLTEAAWAARAGYSRKGGAWNRRRKRHLDAGLIELVDGRWHATPAGVEAAGAEIPHLPAPGEALVGWWAKRLGATGRVLELLAAVHPKALTRDAIAAELGMSAGGGAFNRHIATLKASDLVVEAGKRLSIAEELLK